MSWNRLAREGIAVGVALALVCLSQQKVQAHRLDAALTTVEISAVTGKLVVSHRMYAHDLEHALRLGSVGLLWFDTKEGGAQLGAYAADRFALFDGDGQRINLVYKGAETEGDLVWVYFDADKPLNVSAFVVGSQLLNDFSESQTNLVTIRIGEVTRSATFKVGSEPARLVFPHKH